MDGLKCMNLHTVIMYDVSGYSEFMCLGSRKEMPLKVKQILVWQASGAVDKELLQTVIKSLWKKKKRDHLQKPKMNAQFFSL